MNQLVRMLPREYKYHVREELDQVIFRRSLLTARVLENRLEQRFPSQPDLSKDF